jgi:hypothetical protein
MSAEKIVGKIRGPLCFLLPIYCEISLKGIIFMKLTKAKLKQIIKEELNETAGLYNPLNTFREIVKIAQEATMNKSLAKHEITKDYADRILKALVPIRFPIYQESKENQK